MNLFKFDNLFLVNNVDRTHWNLFVIYFKLQYIKLINSQIVNDDSINKLKTVWGFLWRYCEDKNIDFDAKKWKIYHSRPSLISESDHFNSGYYAILYVAAIYHRADPCKFTQASVNYFRSHLFFYFHGTIAGKKRILAFVMLGIIIMKIKEFKMLKLRVNS